MHCLIASNANNSEPEKKKKKKSPYYSIHTLLSFCIMYQKLALKLAETLKVV